MTTLKSIAVSSIAVMILVAWAAIQSPNTPAAKATPAPSQLETGRFALQKMLAPGAFLGGGRAACPPGIFNLKDSNGHDGKANFWRAQFASVVAAKGGALYLVRRCVA